MDTTSSEGLLFCSLQSSTCSTNSDEVSDEGDLVPILVANNPERGCVFIFDKSKYIETNNEQDEYVLVPNDDATVNTIVKELINEILQSVIRENVENILKDLVD